MIMRFSGMKLNKPAYILIILLCIAEMLVEMTCVTYPEFQDTWSYYGAIDCILKGSINDFRTPVYPIFLALCHFPFREMEMSWIVIAVVQWAIFMVSVIAFGQLCKRIVGNNVVSLWLTVFYALWPGITLSNNVILTESLAVSGVTFFMYCMVKAFQDNSVKYMLASVLLVLTLIFLRPIFVYLILAVVLFALCIMFINHTKYRRLAWCAIAGGIICTGFVTLYMAEMKHRYNVFSISTVTTHNNFFFIAEMTPPDSEYAGNDSLRIELKEFMESKETDFGKIWGRLYDMLDKYGDARMGQEVNALISDRRSEMAELIMRRFVDAADYPIFFNMEIGILDKFTPRIWIIYVLFFVSSILILYGLVKKRIEIPKVFICWLVFSGGVLTGIAGGQDGWDRLLLPAMSAMLILGGYIISSVQMFKR